MKALVYHGPGSRSWDDVPDPEITAPTDVVMRVDAVTICGTDLHILEGDVPEVEPGTILGHEAVGTVVETGAAVTTLREGDRILASCITSCGRCPFCRAGRYGLCTGGGGWILGHLVDGVQAEYARIPFADTSAYTIPPQLTDEQVLFLADILPTSYEVGVLAGQVKPGDTIAVVGAGPIGLAAVLTANLYSPGRIIVLDPDQGRIDRALACGATHGVSEGGDAARDRVLELTDGAGVDVAIEAVGIPATFELCADIVRSGGHVANVGVHGKPATLHLERLWIKGVTITTGLVDTFTTPRLMQLIVAGKLDPSVFATHRFSLDEAMTAYDAFADAKSSGAFKVVLEGAKHRQLLPAHEVSVPAGSRA
jgi:alcohol dehydrogenase